MAQRASLFHGTPRNGTLPHFTELRGTELSYPGVFPKPFHAARVLELALQRGRARARDRDETYYAHGQVHVGHYSTEQTGPEQTGTQHYSTEWTQTC